MFAVDTNVLLYAVNENCEEHPACGSLVRRWRLGKLPWFVSWGVLYEFLRVSTHPRIFPSPLAPAEAMRFLGGILAAPALTVLEHSQRHQAVLEQTLAEVPEARGNLVHDAHLAVLMREHGIHRVYTRNAVDFQKFPFLEVIDPLNERP